MLQISNIHINLADTHKPIVRGVDLEVHPGEVHLLNGKNGSGKSTLVNTVMGNPSFEIASGEIKILKETISEHIAESIDKDFITKKADHYELNIAEMEPNERSLAGIFLANQYPTEIPGVKLSSYLRLIYNARREQENQLPVFKFKKLLREKAEIISYPEHLLERNLNEGFSGGEKKKTEILQMLVLEPKYILLDEIDSGLDKHSVKEVFEGLVKFKELFPSSAFIIITHYDRVQEFLKPDYIHEMEGGLLTTTVS